VIFRLYCVSLQGIPYSIFAFVNFAIFVSSFHLFSLFLFLIEMRMHFWVSFSQTIPICWGYKSVYICCSIRWRHRAGDLSYASCLDTSQKFDFRTCQRRSHELESRPILSYDIYILFIEPTTFPWKVECRGWDMGGFLWGVGGIVCGRPRVATLSLG